MLKAIMGLIMFWSKLSDKYAKICSEGRQTTSVYFGVRAIISIITGIILMGLFAIGLGYAAGVLMNSLLFLFGIVIAAGLAVGILVAFVNGVIGSLICVIYQLRLNRGPMGWIALAVWILFLVAGVIGALYIVNNF